MFLQTAMKLRIAAFSFFGIISEIFFIVVSSKSSESVAGPNTSLSNAAKESAITFSTSSGLWWSPHGNKSICCLIGTAQFGHFLAPRWPDLLWKKRNEYTLNDDMIVRQNHSVQKAVCFMYIFHLLIQPLWNKCPHCRLWYPPDPSNSASTQIEQFTTLILAAKRCYVETIIFCSINEKIADDENIFRACHAEAQFNEWHNQHLLVKVIH